MKLNLGCGSTKLKGYINIDAEKSCKPDLVHNFIDNKLPYKANSIDEIVLFHTIEHISKKLHHRILIEAWRLLKPGKPIYISYPEFTKCYDNWKKNYRGKKDFWEATLYGRQLYPTDTHVCIMHTPEFKLILEDHGFINVISKPELSESYNTMLVAYKGEKPANYVDLVANYIGKIKVNKT